MQGRLGRLAEGKDDQGMPGVHRGPHSRLQVHPELSPFFTFLFSAFMFFAPRYKFRIKAENAYGISDESQESDPFDVNQPIAGESIWVTLSHLES